MRKKVYALYRGERNITDGTLKEIATEIGCSVKNLMDIRYITRHRGLSDKDSSQALALYEIEYEGDEA